jgi:hypothetical protein
MLPPLRRVTARQAHDYPELFTNVCRNYRVGVSVR